MQSLSNPSTNNLDAVPLAFSRWIASGLPDVPFTASCSSFTSLKQKASQPSAIVLLSSKTALRASLFTYIHRVAYYNDRDLSELYKLRFKMPL
jgi:hypothetical protein